MAKGTLLSLLIVLVGVFIVYGQTTISSGEYQSLLKRLESAEYQLKQINNKNAYMMGAPLQNWGYINAADPPYSATGNGVTDDGPAIQKALNAVASQGGGIVWLPAGNYFISSGLTVPTSVTLKGVAEHPWRSWGSKGSIVGTTLYAVANAGNVTATPFVFLTGPNSGIEGLSIFHPNQVQTSPPVAYPFSIGGSGDNLYVKNVLLVNSYQGIDFGTLSCPRHLIQGVYGQILYLGIKIDQIYDIGRINDIHIWPFWSSATPLLNWINANATTFLFLRSDWEVVSDVFSWGYSIGMSFQQGKYGSLNGQFTNINFDNVDIGILANNSQPWGLMFSNLNLANAGGGTRHISIWGPPGGTAQLVLRGLSVWGLVHQAVLWENNGWIEVTDGLVQPNPNKNVTSGAIEIVNGSATIRGVSFWDQISSKVAVKIHSTSNRVIVTGNDLFGNNILNSGTNTVIMNNIN